MTDTNESASVLFGLLSRLTNEDQPEEEREKALYDRFNKLQERANSELYDLLAQTSYPGKYQLFEQIRLLLLSVRLYSVIPDLINTCVTGFYHPDGEMLRALQERFLEQSEGQSFLTDVPTLLTHKGADGAPRTAFSVGERIVEIDAAEYRDLLSRSACSDHSAEKIELSGVMHLLHIRSARVPAGRAILVFPKEFSGHGKYDRAIFNLCDELALFCGNRNIVKFLLTASSDEKQKKKQAVGSKDGTALWELLHGSNVKQLLVNGAERAPDESMPDEVNLGMFTASLQVLDSGKSLAEQLEHGTAGKQNFCHAIWLETLFSDLLWYLSVGGESLRNRFEAVNKDSLSEDSSLKELVSALREELRKLMDQSDELCSKCLRLCEAFSQTLKELEALWGETEGPMSWNEHTISPDGMLAHFYRMCDFSRGAVGSKAQSVRELEALCKSCADAQLARIIANDYFNESSFPVDLEHLKTYGSRNAFIVRLKLRHRSDLDLYEEKCGALIDAAYFAPPLSAEEQRMHGKFLLAQGDREGARQELYEAMARGDRDAGEFYEKNWEMGEKLAKDAALYGVADTAYTVGLQYMNRWKEHHETLVPFWRSMKQRTDILFRSALKYLNIAAANRYLPSYLALSELWFERGMELGGSGKEALDCFHTCINAAQELDTRDYGCADYERLGMAYYHLGEYRTAMEHLKKADTAHALFLQGQMYEEGMGTAKNCETALRRYTSAAEKGHVGARVARDRLSQKLEAEKKEREESERQSYESTRSTSNYSSSGW